jgi:hypothetical protein
MMLVISMKQRDKWWPAFIQEVVEIEAATKQRPENAEKTEKT